MKPGALFFLIAFLAAACSRSPQAVEAVPPIAAISTAPAAGIADPTSAPAEVLLATADLPAPQTTVVSITSTPPPPPASLRRITEGGCCVQPFWSPDSKAVLFLDRPDPNAPSGFYGVGLDGGTPQLVTDRLGNYSGDLQLRAFPERGQTIVEKTSDGQRWVIPSDGRSVSFSPGSAWVAWTLGQNTGGPLEAARREIWVSRTDGSGARRVTASTGGGFSGWIDDNRILVSGRPEDAPQLQALWIVSIPPDGGELLTPVELARAARIRSTVVSPQGGWLVFLVTFSEDAAQDGLWLANTANGEKRKLPLFGAYRWRNEQHLLLIPLEPGAVSHRIWQLDTAGGEPVPLTDPAQTPFRIAGGDWSVAPDGSAVVFLSASDRNLWLLELP